MRRTAPYCFVVAFACLLCCSGLTVAATGGDAVRIAFLTDIHVTPGARSEQALAAIVEEVNDGDFNFLLLTGDLTNTGSDAELQAVKACLDKLTIPYYVLSGNHETNWSESAGKTFSRLFGEDRFVFSYGDYVFAGIATGPYLKMGDGHVKQEDLLWLKATLKEWMKPGRNLIFASHYPLQEGLDNWFEVTDILTPCSPLLALCGHGHRLSFHNADGITGLMGRPSFYKQDTISGYTMVTLKNDSIFIFEKRVGEESPRLFSSFSFDGKGFPDGLAASARPDYSVNERYKERFIPEVVIQDSASVFTGLSLKGDTLVYGNSRGELVAWDQVKKQRIWKKQYEGTIHSTPLIDGERVYLGDTGGTLHALDLRTGEESWSRQLGGPVIGDMLAGDGFLYVGAGKYFCKVNGQNGELVWKFATDGQLQGRPVRSGQKIVFGAWDRHLYCLDSATGDLQWKWNNGHGALLFSPGNVEPAISGEKVFIVAPDRYMTAIDLRTGETVWRTNRHAVRESMGISADGRAVYAKLMNDSIIAVSTEGNEYRDLWVMDAGFGYDHNPCPLAEQDKILYMATKNGLLVAVDTETRAIAFQYKCDHSSVNKIVPDDRGPCVWLTTTEGKIIRLQRVETQDHASRTLYSK